MKVYIGCFGSGLGHAARMLEMARELDSGGSEIQFSSSGEVADLIARKGYRCNRIPLADVHYSDAGEFQVKETLLDWPSIMARTDSQLLAEITNIGRFGPDAVLSDSALPTALAGKLLRVPTFSVLNQLNLTSSSQRKGTLSRLFSVGMSAGMGKLWGLSDGVFLPDLPPPYTISERNLWGSGVENARYVGFLFSREESPPDEAAVEFSKDKRPKLFWQVSGPPRTRAAFLQTALEFAKGAERDYAVVVTGGDPSGSVSPRRIGGIWYYEWCPIADVYFGACDVVVSRAGHGTIAQAIANSKPMLLVPISKQPEQEGNAAKAAKLGMAMVLQQGELTRERIYAALHSLIAGSFRERAAGLGDVAARYDARSTIVSALESASTQGRRGPR
jgi:UDP-N-acetylglucosamine--N-acetylmuramyl-(pentapeptide) pyrophosphoryl-undecaprenol N-acetylglucosamine transferase